MTDEQKMEQIIELMRDSEQFVFFSLSKSGDRTSQAANGSFVDLVSIIAHCIVGRPEFKELLSGALEIANRIEAEANNIPQNITVN